MNSIENLDCPFVMSEIMSGDIDITPLDIFSRLIDQNEDELLADMLNYFYQTQSDKKCKPIDNAIRNVYDNARA